MSACEEGPTQAEGLNDHAGVSPDSLCPSESGGLCQKCKINPAQVLLRQIHHMCLGCVHAHLFSKFRSSLRVQSVITPGDTLGVAFSGGTASAALAHFLNSIRSIRTDRPERNKTAFSLRLIHVDESAAKSTSTGSHQDDPQEHTTLQPQQHQVTECAEQHCFDGATFHSYSLQDVFEGDEASADTRKQRLMDLMSSVGDVTGRQDLIHHLRHHLLLTKAAELGCNILATGHCATTLAAHVIAEAAKGCGYSIAGDIQMTDGRHGEGHPVLMHPLREAGKHELELVCQHKGFKSIKDAVDEANTGDKHDINFLAKGFVDTLQKFNPGAVFNIMSTVSKLEAFSWNDLPQASGKLDAPATSSYAAEVLCPLCSAPLANDEMVPSSQVPWPLCQSCCTQIVNSAGDEGTLLELLPDDIKTRMQALGDARAKVQEHGNGLVDGDERLRAAIADCLLD